MNLPCRRSRRRHVAGLAGAVLGPAVGRGGGAVLLAAAGPLCARSTAPVAAEAALAQGPPLPALAAANLVYTLHVGALSRDAPVAEATYRIEPADGRYRIATEGRAVGLVALFYSGTLTQASEGTTGPHGLQPERYVEQRGKRPERRLRFDPARRLMIGLGDPPEVAAPPGTQDRLSIFFQLGLLARGRPALFGRGARFTMPLASMRRIDRPTFQVVGPELQRTAAGTLDCLRVTARNEADASDPVFDVWLATAAAMLPARIRIQEDDGKVIDQILQKLG